MSARRIIVGLCLIGVTVAAWYAATAADLVSRLIVPTPKATYSALVDIVKSGAELRSAILTTV